jgi:hypothetical protein
MPRASRAAPNLADLPRRVIPHLCVMLIAAARRGCLTAMIAIDMTSAVGNGEPPEQARSEPINNPAKKKRHTEKNEQPQCRASESVFAPCWHINLPSGEVPAQRSFFNIEVAGSHTGKRRWGAWGVPRPPPQPPAPLLVPPASQIPRLSAF